MNWLVTPAIGWGAWLVLHSIVIPLVYSVGKKDNSVKKQQPFSCEEK